MLFVGKMFEMMVLWKGEVLASMTKDDMVHVDMAMEASYEAFVYEKWLQEWSSVKLSWEFTFNIAPPTLDVQAEDLTFCSHSK